MKARKEHRVPLSSRAVAILEQARDCFGGDGLIFPSNRKMGALSNEAFPGVARPVRDSRSPAWIPVKFPRLAGRMYRGVLGSRGKCLGPYVGRTGVIGIPPGRTILSNANR